MALNKVKVASLNVNGLGNPIKRRKVLTRVKKEEAQIVFLQEMHLSKHKHEKLKKFGFANCCFSSCKNNCKRGVSILQPLSVNFELIETCDKEGRFIIVKGKIDNILIT